MQTLLAVGLTTEGPEVSRIDGIVQLAGVNAGGQPRLLKLNDDGTIGGSASFTPQPANFIFAGPSSGIDAAPAFRFITQRDLHLATVNILDYGGNNLGSGDNIAAVASAVAALPANGGIVLCPAGTYNFLSSLTTSGKPVIFIGDGSDADNSASPTIFNFLPTSAIDCIALNYNGSGIIGITVVQGNSQANCNGIVLAGINSCYYSSVLVTEFTGIGWWLKATASASCIWNDFEHIRARFNGTGILLQGNTANGKACNSNAFHSCQFIANNVNNIKLIDTTNDNSFDVVDATKSSGTATTLIVIGDGTNESSRNSFRNLVIEGGTVGVQINNNSSGTFIHGYITSATKIQFPGVEQPTWFYDTATKAWATYGNVGFRHGIDGSIGMGAAAPLLDGKSINLPSTGYIAASGTTVLTVNSDASVSFNGTILLSGVNLASKSGGINYLWSGTDSLRIINAAGSVDLFTFSNAGVLNVTTAIQINSDVVLVREAANILAQRNGVNAQAFKLYNTFTDASNYERLGFDFSSNRARIYSEAAGTGTTRTLNIGGSSIFLNPSGIGSNTGRWAFTGTSLTADTTNVNFYNGVSALATNATVGFLGVNSCAGTPTGTPGSIPTGQIPLVYDSTNNKLGAYAGGVWKSFIPESADLALFTQVFS